MSGIVDRAIQDLVSESLGESWVLKTAKQKYGSMMEAGRNTLKEFLLKRSVLLDFVTKILSGPGKMDKTLVEMELLQSRNEGSDQGMFKISW